MIQRFLLSAVLGPTRFLLEFPGPPLLLGLRESAVPSLEGALVASAGKENREFIDPLDPRLLVLDMRPASLLRPRPA